MTADSMWGSEDVAQMEAALGRVRNMGVSDEELDAMEARAWRIGRTFAVAPAAALDAIAQVQAALGGADDGVR